MSDYKLFFNGDTQKTYHFLKDVCMVNKLYLKHMHKNDYQVKVEFLPVTELPSTESIIVLRPGWDEGLTFNLLHKILPNYVQSFITHIHHNKPFPALQFIVKSPFIITEEYAEASDMVYLYCSIFCHDFGYEIRSDGKRLGEDCRSEYRFDSEFSEKEIEEEFKANIDKLEHIVLGTLSVKTAGMVNHSAPLKEKRLCLVKKEDDTWERVTARNKQLKDCLHRERSESIRQSFVNVRCPAHVYEVGKCYRKTSVEGEVSRILSQNDKCILWQSDCYMSKRDMLGVHNYALVKTVFYVEYDYDGNTMVKPYGGVYQELIDLPPKMKPLQILYYNSIELGYENGQLVTSHPDQYVIGMDTKYIVNDIEVFELGIIDEVLNRSYDKQYAAYYGGRVFRLSESDILVIELKKQKSLVEHLVV